MNPNKENIEIGRKFEEIPLNSFKQPEFEMIEEQVSKEDEESHAMKSSIKSDFDNNFSEIKMQKGTITEPGSHANTQPDNRQTEVALAAQSISQEKPVDSARRQGTEVAHGASAQKSSVAQDNSLNLRGKLWKILCKTDVLVVEMLDEYAHNIDKVGPSFKQSIVENKKASRPSL